MKKAVKISLIAAGILVAVGMLLTLAGIVLGGGFGAMRGPLWKFGISYQGDDGWDIDMDWVKDRKDKNRVKSYKAEDIKAIELEVAAGEFSVEREDVSEIEIYCRPANTGDISLEGKTLKISDNTKGIRAKRSEIQIVVPRHMQLEKFSAKVSAGELDIEEILAKKYDFEVAAGRMEANLPGRKEDYNISLNVNMGEIRLDDRDYSGLSSEKELINDSADKDLVVQCDLGSCEIEFED